MTADGDTTGRGAVEESSTSPITGWTRATWADLADRMLLAVRPYASTGHGRITLPGDPGGNGSAVDGLEGFARTFLLAGFRLAGERGGDPLGLADWYAAGLAAGTDPRAEDRWVRPAEHPQAKVEAASLALVLDLTRPWLWDRLDPAVQERVVAYLGEVVGDATYPRNNWVWFRLVVQTFLRSVDGPWSVEDMRSDLETHDSFRQEDGWFADGQGRAYDHYTGWALHLFPTLWARMTDVATLPDGMASGRADRDRADLDRYLTDAVHLVGADGSPLLQGRSLTYRFAAAAPFWVGAVAQVPSVPLGQLRRAASGIARHFVEHGAPDEDGLLTIGWHHPWRGLAQSYSGTGSPYWASKGMLGLALPADHPAWTAVEEPLPVEQGDTLRPVAAPGWLVHGTRSDGVVRVVNHGTDHDVEGTQLGDSPLYARLGYSTATSPLLHASAWTDPLDGAVVLLDDQRHASHRAGMTSLGVRLLRGPGRTTAGVGASRGPHRWLSPHPQQRDHGHGLAGDPRPAGEVTVVSVVRGPWEVRLVRVDAAAGDARTLRVGGWSVPADGDLVSTVDALLVSGAAAAGSTTSADATPLASMTRTPWVEVPVRPGRWQAFLVVLRRDSAVHPSGTGSAAARLDATTPLDAGTAGLADVEVTWPDGDSTALELDAVVAAGPPRRSERKPLPDR